MSESILLIVQNDISFPPLGAQLKNIIVLVNNIETNASKNLWNCSHIDNMSTKLPKHQALATT